MSVLHVMNAAGTLPSPLADEMRRVLEATLQRHTAQLGLTGVDVALRVLPWGLPETGIHGFAPTGSYVELTVSPDNPEFLPGWRTELPATLAHELHHARRWRGPVSTDQNLITAPPQPVPSPPALRARQHGRRPAPN